MKSIFRTTTLAVITLLSLSWHNHVSAQSTIQSLPNGIYKFCQSPELANNTSDLQAIENNGYCFTFQKKGNQVGGGYHNAAEGDKGICISGKVNKNTITGQGLEMEYSGIVGKPIQPQPERSGKQFVSWDGIGRLQVRRQTAINIPRNGGYFVGYRYLSVILNLQDFYRHSLPEFTPPLSCNP